MAEVIETRPVAVWRCAGCHCSTEVFVPKPLDRCPACGVYMLDDIRQLRPDTINDAMIAARERKEGSNG
jgi:hypothetical protein